MGKIHLYHIIAWIFSEFFWNLLTFYSRDVWQMYLDKNEFELAKEYCRVRFDCKLSSLIDSFHLVDVHCTSIYMPEDSFQEVLSNLFQHLCTCSKNCLTMFIFPRKSVHKVDFAIKLWKNFLSFKTFHVLGQCGSAG